jgi:hypothetical protein
MTGTARDKTHEARPGDAFMTIDPRVIPALLTHFKPFGVTWEPAAGEGHLVRALEAAGHAVRASDIDPRYVGGFGGGFDFLTAEEAPPDVRCIATNPPNTLNIEFAKKAIELMEPVCGMVALYQRHEWDCTKESAEIFDHPAYAYKITCRFRPRWIEPKEGEKAASPFHRWSWFVWDFASIGLPALQRFA